MTGLESEKDAAKKTIFKWAQILLQLRGTAEQPLFHHL